MTAGIVGIVALGIAAAPTIQKEWSSTHASGTPAAEPTTPPPAAARPAPRAHAASRRAPEVAAVKSPNTIETVSVSVWTPELRDRVKAVLNPGAKPEIAAEDFSSPEQFMTVAHAARNTQVPFMVLKDRVLNQGQSLAQAIHEFKPDLDAKAEVTRARAAAREDLESVG
jgi:hypothetical protein